MEIFIIFFDYQVDIYGKIITILNNMNERTEIMYMDIHPWVGTQHCLREDGGCVNDHTGCMWNDGHNGCMHPAKEKIISPLLSKENDRKVKMVLDLM